MHKLIGLDSAVDEAKVNRRANMMISSELVIEMAAEIEELTLKLQQQCARMGAVLAENNELQEQLGELKKRDG